MGRFVAARLGHAIVVSFLVTTIAFFLVHLAPGDPFSLDSPRVTEDVRIKWRHQFGYDRPLAEQYWRYLGSVATGQLGYSHSLHVPVSDALAQAVPRTLWLMGSALTLSFALGIWLGVFEAQHSGEGKARAANAASLLVNSLPDFWIALMVLLAFAYWLPLFPAGDMTEAFLHEYMSPMRALWDRIVHLVLPLLSLTLVATAVIARFQRAALLDALPSDFIRTARAKGVSDASLVRTHALRNALLPMITIAGLSFPALLGGAVFVERIFAWPGMGYLMTTAVATRDYPLVLAAVLIGSFLVVAGSALADIGYALADPRVRVR
ncbi:MAG TPA: ABC transporter permease [Gemmatimonadaceae bacterium]